MRNAGTPRFSCLAAHVKSFTSEKGRTDSRGTGLDRAEQPANMHIVPSTWLASQVETEGTTLVAYAGRLRRAGHTMHSYVVLTSKQDRKERACANECANRTQQTTEDRRQKAENKMKEHVVELKRKDVARDRGQHLPHGPRLFLPFVCVHIRPVAPLLPCERANGGHQTCLAVCGPRR